MVVLDTCALIHDALETGRLSQAALKLLEDASESGQLALGDISLWEVAMLVQHGRLQLGVPVDDFLENALAARKIRVLSITPAIAAESVRLDLHRDPADRLIAATAKVHRATLVTTDKLLKKTEGVRVVR
jgi:PIN domain nuclease of toxin-antitoxin system